MPSGCARIPTSSIFITTSRPQLHFHLATSDQRIGVMRKLVLTFSMVGAPIPFSAFAAALKVALPVALTAPTRQRLLDEPAAGDLLVGWRAARSFPERWPAVPPRR
jgi:hypothetical protein